MTSRIERSTDHKKTKSQSENPIIPGTSHRRYSPKAPKSKPQKQERKLKILSCVRISINRKPPALHRNVLCVPACTSDPLLRRRELAANGPPILPNLHIANISPPSDRPTVCLTV